MFSPDKGCDTFESIRVASPTPSSDGRQHQPEVQARLDEAARLVSELGHAQFARMTAPELLQWLRANNRVGYGNLVRALFEITP